MSTAEPAATAAPARRPGLAWVDVDGEIVVGDEETGRLTLLNPTASLVFQCLDGTSTLREIAADIADVLGADPATVEGDVVALAAELRRLELLEHGEGDGE